MVELMRQAYDGGSTSLRIGAGEPLQVVFEHPDCPALLRGVLSGAVAWQKRNEMKAAAALRWSAQWQAALLALGAIVLSDGKEETLADFLGREGAIGKLSEIRLPLDVPGRAWGEAHVRRTPTDVPIVSAIAVVDAPGGKVHLARLALAGVWSESVRLAKAADLLLGSALDKAAIHKAAAAAQQEVNPRDNFLGSAEYRREMAAVLSRRALEMCLEGGKQA